MATKRQVIEKTAGDKAAVIHDFIEGKLNPKDFSSQVMDDRYLRFIAKEILENADESKASEIESSLKQLAYNLHEFKNYLTYEFVIEDVRRIYDDKEKYKNSFAQTKKSIEAEEKKIIKLDNKISKSKKINTKLVNEQETLILKVRDMYRELEKNKIYYQIATQLEDNSTVRDVLYLASSFYNYISDCMRDVNKNVEEEEVETTIRNLREFVLWPYGTILTKLNIQENKDILIMIKDRYKLLDINITEEALDIDNIDELMIVLKNIEIGNNIRKNKIDVEELKYICDFKKILGK